MRLSSIIVFAAFVLLASASPIDDYSEWKTYLFDRQPLGSNRPAPLAPPSEYRDSAGTVIRDGPRNSWVSHVTFQNGPSVTFHYAGKPWVVLSAQNNNAPPFTYTEFGEFEGNFIRTYLGPNNDPILTLVCLEGYRHFNMYYAQSPEDDLGSYYDYTARHQYTHLSDHYNHYFFTRHSRRTISKIGEEWHEGKTQL